MEVHEKRRQHADEDCKFELNGESRQECHGEDQRVAAVRACDAAHLRDVDESPGDDEQQPGHHRQWQVRGEGCHAKQYDEEQCRREHRREWRLRTGFEVDAAATERP